MYDDDLVLPSSLLEVADNNYYGAFNKSYNNVSLKMGIVKKVYEIEDSKNLSKKVPEYDVLTFDQDQNKGITPLTLKNCITMDAFGGIADFMDYRKIVPTLNPDGSKLDKDDGSYVLVLCIDGSNTKGVIIGALPHHARKAIITKDKTAHMESEFNGIRMKINKDGEFTLTFKGKTDKKGKPVDAAKGGSQIRIEKDGSVEINDRDLDGELKAGNNKEAKDTSVAGADYERIRIDKTKKSIGLNTRGDFTETIGANSSSTIKGNTTHKTTNLVLEAGGTASLKSTGAFNVEAGGAFGLKGPSGTMTFDDSLTVNASAANILAQSINLGQGGTPSVLLSTQTIGIGNLGSPIVSTMIGPFSSTVFIAP